MIEKMPPILDVQNLTISFSIQGRKYQAVRDVSFELFQGEAIGIVGESGCGKSITVQALTRLISSPPATIESGRVFLENRDLLQLPADQLRAIRGKKIGMIFQDPMTALNPTMKIGMQIQEVLHYHRLPHAHERSLELLHLVGLPEPELRFSQYPHQLSGGMRQRVLIAIALAANPRILIADEPTTALDPTIQAQILALLKQLKSQFNMSLILISHDIGVVAGMCDRVIVMYAGKVVEQGSVVEVLNHPQHPYTKLLLQSLPRLDREKGEALFTIEGSPPTLLDIPIGCPFAERCPQAMNICLQEMPSFFSRARCFLHDPEYKS